MKTAVDWLVDHLYLVIPNEERNFLEGMRKEALEKEKEQIIEFCCECLKGDNIHTITSNKELIEYINNRYNQTYNQNK